jgi:hypothetical protein
MRLIDIPPHQSLVFMRFKQGRVGGCSKKLPIVNHTVTFAEPLAFDYKMPQNPSARHPKPLRLSFRFENVYNSGFTRYGIAEIDVMQRILDNDFSIRILLSDCSYNTYFVATLTVPGGSPFADGTVNRSATDTAPSPTLVRSRSSSSSSAASDVLFEASPVRVSRERFDELETQVDLLFASIINGEDPKAL